MAAKPHDQPQVTRDQIDIWLTSPVTQAMLTALHWKHRDSIHATGSGKLVDSSSADLTHAIIHGQMGKQDAYAEATDPVGILESYDLIFEPEEETE